MKTVKEIIEELNKFPPDATVYGYSGEATGIGIKYVREGIKPLYGFIHCNENEREILNLPTEYLR